MQLTPNTTSHSLGILRGRLKNGPKKGKKKGITDGHWFGHFGPLTSGLRFRIPGPPRQGAVVFLKSEPGRYLWLSFLQGSGGGAGRGSRATNLKVKAEDSGGPPILGSLRAEVAFDQCGLHQPSVDLGSLQGKLDCARS